MSSQISRVTCFALAAVVACGQEATQPPPQNFDDPFAENASEPAPAPAPAAEPVDTKVAIAEPTPPAEIAAPAGAEATADKTDAPAEPTTAVPTKTDKAPEQAKTGKTKSSEPAAKHSPAEKPVEPVEPAPVPEDSPPQPPASPPASAPAPVTETPPAPQTPPQPAQQRFAGTYALVNGATQRQNVADAIEATVMQVNALIRGIARRRLTGSNKLRDQLSIAVDGTKVSMTFSSLPKITATLDGPAITWSSDTGEKMQVSLSLVKGRLVHDFIADDGTRRNVYTLNESGDKLTLSVTVASPRLPSPLKYALTYKRQ